MGNSYAGQLRNTRFQEVLHYSIEASLRSSTVLPRPVFSQLYLDTEPTGPHNGRLDADDEDEEDEENVSESSPPTASYQKKPPPEGCCTTDGFCQAGRDVRLSSLSSDPLDVPPGSLLVGVKSSQVLDSLLVCAVDGRFLPDEHGRNALLGFSGACVGCGEKGFRYFTEFANHINLKLSTQPKKQKHLKHLLLRNNQGALVETIPPPLQADAPSALTNGSHAVPPPSTLSGPGRPTTTAATAAALPSVQPPPAPALLNSSCPQPAEAVAPPTVSQGSFLPLLSSHGASVTVPDHLLQTCRLQPVIFKGWALGGSHQGSTQQMDTKPISPAGHGPLPQLRGNVGEVLVSSLLHTCYLSSQTLPQVYQHYGPSPIQPLSTEMQILLTVYYLVQLGPDQVPLVEDLEQIFMRSWRESHLSEIRQYQQPPAPPDRLYGLETGPSQQALTPSQLPWLAQLAASSCGEAVVVLGEQEGSLAQGLSQTFSRLLDGGLVNTNYVVIIVTPAGQETQSCVVVTGKHQCRALSESVYSPSEGLRAIDQQLSSGLAQDLAQYCNSLGSDCDMDSLLDAVSLDSQQSSPLSSSQESGDRSPARAQEPSREPGKEPGKELGKGPTSPKHTGSPGPSKDTPSPNPNSAATPRRCLAVARKLLSHVCAIADSSTQNLDLGSFDRLSFLICVPPSEVTFQQTLLHLRASGVLQEMAGVDQEGASAWEAERYVVKMDQSAAVRIHQLVQEARHNAYTLYILVHDHAHWDVTSASYFSVERGVGVVDELLNSRQVTDAPNVLLLHVTSFPFALQTQNTRISPYNEVHWPSAFSNDVDLYHEKTRYLGVSELLESTRLGSSLPLMRYDSAFESMASALEDRFPKLHSAVVRTTVLVQHYCVALMAASSRLHPSQHNLHKHTSVETLEIIQSLLGAAQRCPAHHGHMVLLRIPSLALAAWAQRRLADVRRRLGLEDSFEIVLGTPGQPLNIGHSFTQRIKSWLDIQDAGWVPGTYLELEALPCLLILSGAEPLGESLPRSLKYCDLRVISSSYLQRTTLEQELGLAAYLVRAESRPPHDPGPGSDILESDADKLSSTDNEEEEEDSGSPPLPGQQAPPSADAGPAHDTAAPLPLGPPPEPPRLTPSDTHTRPRPSTPPRPRLTLLRLLLPPPLLLLWPSPLLPPPPRARRQPSKSSSSDSLSPGSASSPLQSCSWARGVSRPSSVLLPRALYDIITASDGSGLPRCTSFLPHMSVAWASSFRPLLSKMMTCTEQSLYYRQWTAPRPQHMDRTNRTEGRSDNFHPRRLLLSGPPQVLRSMPFDYAVHDPKHEDISTVMKLSKHAAYNAYHHCEQCHQYMGFNPRYQLGDDIQLFFIIPKSKEHYFSFSQSGGQLESLRLPLTSDWSPDCIKSPIFTPTTGRHEHGLFNLFHAMEGAAHLHILVVKEYENWAIYKNPDCIKSPIFTPTTGRHEHGLFNLFHAMEGAAHLHILEGGGPPGDVWPFIVVADDSCVMWNTVDVDARGGLVERGASLKQVLQTLEACPDLAHLGVLRHPEVEQPWTQSEPFHRGHLHDLLLVNVERCGDVRYDQHRFSCHDVDFGLRAHSAGLLLCRFNRFSMTDVPTSVGPAQYVCAPDSKHLFLAAPPQLLLERYLQHTGPRLFPLGTQSHAHPVLSVDCFLNLGPQVTVCFVSSRPRALNLSTAGLLFSGLLLGFTDAYVSPAFLRKFTFLKGATLCVICADRSSLRHTVGRLELEEAWRFRLSDEFQTANAKEDRPLFFLTGKHI
ncbi:hypothetical protein CRUP_016774 [Coryphaenoides rupestris]|nr:hypothetical protein CRUP_016774 [Coryphaenoides rupestris]